MSLIRRQLWIGLILTLLMTVSACVAPAPSSAPSAEQPAASGDTATTDQSAASAIQIPAIEQGKFNVAFVYVGPIGDGGWTYAHNEGRLYVEEKMGDKVHTVYLENVPEGTDAERVIRNLARAGFDAVFTTSFGYMDPTETVASEFPDKYFVHVSGYKKADNFANLFGAMESMKYLSGMIAGARAAEDGSKRVGYIAPFPIPEVIRLLNATALGMRKTCADCVMDIRWTFSWFDPNLERESAASLIDGGASVVVTGADTPGPVQVSGEKGKWGIGYDSSNACDVDKEHCLTVPYWIWGGEYVDLITSMMDKSFKGDSIYFDVDSGHLGILGFMEGQTPQPGVPESVIPQVKEVLAKMQSGEMTRFDVFAGPVMSNKGETIIPEGEKLTQSDLEGGSDCKICMNWLVEGVDPQAEIPSSK